MRGSLQIKGNKYYVVLPDGKKRKWLALDISASKGNKRKAERKMAEVVLEYQNPQTIHEMKTSFSDFAKKWLKHTEANVDKITYEGYDQYVNKHLIPYFDDRNLAIEDITLKDIENYYNLKSVSGRLDGKEGGLSARSIKLHAVTLNLIFKHAIINGLIKENPCTYAKIPKTAKKSEKHIDFYTEEECKKLLELTKGTPLHNIVLITFLYGLRRSEVMGLRWKDIDFEENTLTICHTRVIHKTLVEKDKTKNTSSNRIYPLIENVKSMLLEVKETQDHYRNLFGNAYNESDYVFTHEDGVPYYPSYPSHQLSKVLKNSDMRHIRFHDLRHSCASYLLSKGWNMKSIADWLGHSEISTTMNIYAHINLAQKREMAKELENAL